MDKITELKSLLSKAWHVAYQLEMDGRASGDLETPVFFHELNGEINALEGKLLDFVKDGRHG